MRVGVCADCGLRAVVWGIGADGAPLCVGCSAPLAGEAPAWVVRLRADHAAGLSYGELGERYGMDPTNARKIALGLAYRTAA